MYREERLVIKLNEAERCAIERYAKAVNLPVSTLARAMLLSEAERRGFWQNEENRISTNSKSVGVEFADPTHAFAQ